jgi:TetR/AcrR family transcriptional regulator, repressor for uid operon
MRKGDPVKFEEKRQEILEGAARCFMRDGFRGASISTICAEAQISPGHLYHYFPSKEAIIEAMAATHLESIRARFSQLADKKDAIAVITAELQRSRKGASSGEQALILDLMAEAGRNPAIAKIVHSHTRAIRGLLAETLRNGQATGGIDPNLDVELAAYILINLMDGSKILRIRDPKIDTQKCDEMLATMIARFLSGNAAMTVS